MIYEKNWRDYALLDTSDGERLERWGKYVLIRPDPQAIWRSEPGHAMWHAADAMYRRSSDGGGRTAFQRRGFREG